MGFPQFMKGSVQGLDARRVNAVVVANKKAEGGEGEELENWSGGVMEWGDRNGDYCSSFLRICRAKCSLISVWRGMGWQFPVRGF